MNAGAAGSAENTTGSAKSTARSARDSAERAGEQAVGSTPFRVLVTVGLITYGIVHILVGWIAVQVAWGAAVRRRRPSRARWPSWRRTRPASSCCG